MTTARQMFALQELDIILDRIQGDQSKAELELNNSNSVGKLETELERDCEWLQETVLQRKATKLEAETQKVRSESLNSQLYGGEITNPRDLEVIEREASNVRLLVEQHETSLSGINEQIAEARKFGKDVLGDAVRKKFLFPITRHVFERQNGDRGLVGKSKRCGFYLRRAFLGFHPDPVYMRRSFDVFELLFAEIVEIRFDLSLNLTKYIAGNQNATRVGERFQSRRDIYAIAIDIIVLHDHVAKIHADAELDTLDFFRVQISLRYAFLEGDGASHCVQNAGKLGEKPITGGFHDSSPVFNNAGVNQFGPVGGQRGERSFLVTAHKPRIPDHIRGGVGHALLPCK